MAWRFDTRDFRSVNGGLMAFFFRFGIGNFYRMTLYDICVEVIRWRQSNGWFVYSEEVADPPEEVDGAPPSPAPANVEREINDRRMVRALFCHEEIDNSDVEH